MATRIYEVFPTAGGGNPKLVEASSQAEAIKHVQTEYTAKMCPTLRVVELMATGVKVEKAGVKS